MTKAEIVNEIAHTTGVDKASVLAIVEKFMEVIKDSLANGQKTINATKRRIRQINGNSL